VAVDREGNAISFPSTPGEAADEAVEEAEEEEERKEGEGEEEEGPGGATFALTVEVRGTGAGRVSGDGISCPGTCSASYPVGTQVKLEAGPSDGSSFAGWSGAPCAGAAVCSFEMSADRQIGATFTTRESTPGGDSPKGQGGKSLSTLVSPPDFTTAIFDGESIAIRLKCPARFQPRCEGSAAAVTTKDRRGGKVMTSTASAAQRPLKWKVVKLRVSPQYRARIAQMTKQPAKRQLVVRQSLRAGAFRGGRQQIVFHVYRVRSAG
jgi:hypothetical protein